MFDNCLNFSKLNYSKLKVELISTLFLCTQMYSSSVVKQNLLSVNTITNEKFPKMFYQKEKFQFEKDFLKCQCLKAFQTKLNDFLQLFLQEILSVISCLLCAANLLQKLSSCVFPTV